MNLWMNYYTIPAFFSFSFLKKKKDNGPRMNYCTIPTFSSFSFLKKKKGQWILLCLEADHAVPRLHIKGSFCTKTWPTVIGAGCQVGHFGGLGRLLDVKDPPRIFRRKSIWLRNGERIDGTTLQSGRLFSTSSNRPFCYHLDFLGVDVIHATRLLKAGWMHLGVAWVA